MKIFILPLLVAMALVAGCKGSDERANQPGKSTPSQQQSPPATPAPSNPSTPSSPTTPTSPSTPSGSPTQAPSGS